MNLPRLKARIAAGALVACAAVVPAWAGPLATGAAAPVASLSAGPFLDHTVAFRGSKVLVKKVKAPAVTVRVGKRKRCAVAAWTPLAALVRAKPGKVLLKDFGSCSLKNAQDGAGLFVKSIRGQQNHRQDGWVYKVGRRLGTAGVADPSGPFGSGRLRAGQRLLWFYCVYEDGSCQRTLEVKLKDQGGGIASAFVRGFDDGGNGVPVEGAKVTAGAASAITGADGRTSLQLSQGLHVVYASKAGAIRSFGERLTVR